MRTDLVKLIRDEAPPHPACFDSQHQWVEFLVSAHASGAKVVRRVDTGKHRGQRMTTFAVLPVGQQSHCAECAKFRQDQMKAAGRCFPVRPPAPKTPAQGRNDDANSTGNRFEVEGVATLSGVRIRKKGAETSRLLIVRLAVHFPKVDARVCGYFDDMLGAFLFRQEMGGRVVRNGALRPVAYANQLNDALVEVDRQSFPRADVSGFVITPLDGTSVSLRCVVSLYPGKANVSHLIHQVQEGVRMRIVGAPDLFDGVGPEAKPSAQTALA